MPTIEKILKQNRVLPDRICCFINIQSAIAPMSWTWWNFLLEWSHFFFVKVPLWPQNTLFHFSSRWETLYPEQKCTASFPMTQGIGFENRSRIMTPPHFRIRRCHTKATDATGASCERDSETGSTLHTLLLLVFLLTMWHWQDHGNHE